MLKSVVAIIGLISIISLYQFSSSNENVELSNSTSTNILVQETTDSIKPLIDQLNKLYAQKKIASPEKAKALASKIKSLKQDLKQYTVNIKTPAQAELKMMDPMALCPEINTVELINVAGFASTDQLVKCGDPDTLAYVVFIEEPGDILGAQMTLTFETGMQYAGFELTHYPGSTISNLDPDPIKPKFLLEGITDAVFIAYIGVESTCDADINGLEYRVDLEYNFTFQDTFGNVQTCRQKAFPTRVYNSTIKTPVLNYRSSPNTTITSLSEEYCTTIRISQDGIQAYLKDFDFAVCGIDLDNELSLTSTSVNGIPIGATYSSADSTLSMSIDDSYFPSNTVPNPADNYFDESEQISIELCYEVTDCPIENTQFITYKASWGCHGEYCMSIVDAAEIRIRPTQRPDPYTTVEKLSNPGVCGDPGIIELTMYAAETGSNVAIQDSAAGLFTDVSLGFETCDQSSLGVTQVNIGDTSLPSSAFAWINGDLIIDFQTLTTDPDGAGGITDADGDGFYDDLPGGETLSLQVELEFLCELPPDPTSIACSSVDCSFASFFISAKRDCGQSFKIFPDIEEFDIINGATYVELKGQTLINNNFYGYNFGVVGNDGSCNPRAAQTRTIEFCYVYERENVEPCAAASTTNELQVVFSGSPIAVYDVQFVPGSGELSVNGVTTTTGATGVFTDVDVDTRAMNLPIGSLAEGDTVCYKYQLVADTAICVPPQYMIGTHQVIETCSTGDCTCVTVKACDATEIRIDPTDCDCTCDISSGATITRWNLGYTDETMTEKVERQDVPVEDLSRFLPCDTILYEGWMKFLSPESVGELYQLYFYGNITNLGYNGWRADETELMIDASGSELLSIEFSKEGSTTRQIVDMTMFPDCLDKEGSGATGFHAHAAETPYGADVANAPMCNSSYEHHDGNLFGFLMRNFNTLEDCRGEENEGWEESDCLQQFLDHFNVEIGDSIHMKYLLPLTKNVKSHARKELDPTFTFSPPQIINVATGHYIDEFDSDCLLALSNCRENTPFTTFCPNGINAVSDMEVDDCGGSVSHEFNVIQSTPVNWYTEEFRPYFNMQDITVPIYTPMMYCGNARLVTDGGVEYPLEVTEYTNHTCATVGTEEYCSVSSGDVGMLTFNLEENGFPGLAVGLGGYIDGFRIEYDLCRVCPVELADLSEYEIEYDYKVCEPLEGSCFRCWVRADGTYAQITEVCSRDGSTPVGHNESYYDYFDADQLFVYSEISEDFNVTDISNGFPALTQTIDRLLLASGSPGSSVEQNTIEICADGADPSLETHMSVLGSVTVTNSLALTNVWDVNTNPIAFNFVSSTGGNSTYSFPMDDLAPGDCVEIVLGTTLLYCPEEPEVAEACLTVTSGCLDRDILAAVVANASECNTSTSCYKYVTEESDIQANFLSFGDEEYPLCGEIPVAALVKNVQAATLTDLALTFNLPITGATIVPGSFMASYPNNGDLSGATPFYNISDPIINGNILSYPEDSVFSGHIHSLGFPGVLSTLDSNFVVVKFLMKTDCDEFVSGNIATFEATAIDPCSPDILSTGQVTSDEFIIQGANPNDFAKILVTAKPSEAFCGQSDPEFTVTGLNISEKPSGDSLQMCITLPDELTYVAGSMFYAIPAGQDVGTETITMIGTQTQVCFAGYNNMPVGGQFTLKFQANFDEDTPCGDYDVGVDIKELRPSEICEDGGVCDVFVQSSVNPDFTVTLKGPLETAELKLTRSCEGGDDPVTMCYEALLNNPGLDYSGTVTVNLHEDLNGNGTYDFFDPIMGTMDFPGTFVAADGSVTLTGCFEVPLAKSCPVILNVVYETECNCDNSVSPFTEIVPGFTVDLPSTIYLCPGEKLALDTCSNYTIAFDPPANVTTESTNDSLYICLVDPSITTEMILTGIGGDCSTYEPFMIEGIEALDLVLAESETCQNVALTLELDLPSKYHDFVDITWSPATNLDDPNILDPIFLSDIPGDYDYEVTMQISETCSIITEVTVTVLPNGEIEIAGDSLFCFDYSPANLTATPGFDYYEWYSLISGFEIIQASTMTNTWSGPLTPGDYLVKGFRSTDQCPSESGLHRVDSKECHDIELYKNVINIPDPFILGDQVTYEIVVCNINDPDIGMVFDADDIQVVDHLPGGVSYVNHSVTDGNYNPGTNEWDIPFLESGVCDTLFIDVTVDEYDCIINDAEVSEMDEEDIDSSPKNDDGDQSEDDEDNAKVQVDTFDLALTKMLNPMQTIPVTIGSTVTYDIEVCNQGMVDAYDISVVDYIPTGMSIADPSWMVGSVANEYFKTITGPITPGNCTTISIITQVDALPVAPATSYTNYAEINSAEDANGNNPPDIDSDPDNDPANDGPVTDDETMNAGGDEDDHDPSEIPVIMLDCEISSNSVVCPGIPLMLEELGMGNVAWSWSGPGGFAANTKAITVDPAVPGTYSVTITDTNGLMSSCEVDASIHPEMSLAGTITDVSCKDGMDGGVDLTVTGGTAPFTYDWSDDGADAPDDDPEDLTGVGVGNYGVIVTDANGCTQIAKFNIAEPILLTCTLEGTDVLCFGEANGTIVVTAAGGVGAYEYSLDGAAYQPGNTFNTVLAGDHIVSVRDEQDCISTCMITIIEPMLLACSTNATNDSSCLEDNGRIEVIGVGGLGTYEYSIDNGATYQSSSIFSGLGAGDYTITVRDENDCTSSCMTSLTSPTPPICVIGATSDITCNSFDDGMLTADGSLGSGMYEYSLDGTLWQASGTFSDLLAGTYMVTIRNRDTPTCTSTCTATLTEPTQVTCQLTSTNVSCLGEDNGEVTVTATGGDGNFDYSIDNGAFWQTNTTFSGLIAGDYDVIVRDNGDDLCSSICEITITEPTILSCFSTPTQVLCNGDDSGGVTITAVGGTLPYEYSLNGAAYQPGNIYAGLEAGDYNLSVRDKNGCITTCPFEITEPLALVCTTVATDATDCGRDDGTITVSASGGVPGYTYSLDGATYQASNLFEDLMAGTHIVSTQDANGCITTCEAIINGPDIPMCQIISVTEVECYGESTGQVIVTGSGGSTPYEFSIDQIAWQTNGVFSDLPAGMHVVYIRNTASPACISMCSVDISEPEELTCLLTPNDPLCFGGSDGNITVIATEGTPGYEYSLDGGPWQPSHVFNGLTAGDYTVTIRDDYRCTHTCTVTLGEPTLLVCSTVVVDLLCYNDNTGSITVNGSEGTPGYDYNLDQAAWQDGNVFENIAAGTYTVYIRDANDCVSNCSATVNEPPLLECELVELVPESCAFNDGSIEVLATGGTAPVTYSIDGGATTQATGLFEDLTLGTYTITIQDANGCIVTCDHEILPDCFDLALTKQLVTGGPYTYGQHVVFDINVINQGNVDATDVEITDHVPCGFEYDPALLINQINDWTLLATAFPMTEISSIPAGITETIQIELIVKECTTANGHVNIAEISEAFDADGNPGDDVDSDPDYDPSNDAGGEPNGPTDDQEDGDGTDDEDDHDPAFVPIYDVALEKELVTEPTYSYGQLVEFAIKVCNQSSPIVTNVKITDHIPVGYSYGAADNPGWSGDGAPTPADVTYTIAGPIAGGDCVSVPIFLTIEMAGGLEDWKNVAEVSEIKDEDGDPVDDVDSDEDNDDGDQSEDDEDAADLRVVDAALVKTTTHTGPFSYGDQVTFDIEVFNQGNVSLHNIEVNDFIPCGYTYLPVNAATWTFDSGTNVATTTLDGPIGPGASDVVSITLQVQPCSASPETAWTNVSEIENFEDEDGENITDEDIDSDADDDPTNDTTEDDVNDNTNGDEDDNDPETIEVFDLAQIKQVVTAAPYAYGDLLEYKITLINQGNVTAIDVVLTDHLPAGLSFDGADNAGWDATNAPSYDYIVTGPILSGDTVCVPIFVTVEMTTGGAENYTNISEISSAADEDGNPGEDADSYPDDDPANDGDPTNDATDDPNEEDDHDPEVIEVVDLALIKTTAATGPFKYGDQVIFDIEVFNQGNVDAYDVVVNDFIPCGYTYLGVNSPLWTFDSGTSIATTTFAGPILPGTSETISITLEVQPCSVSPEAAWTNVSEIESFEDEDGEDISDEDIDSDADDDPTNDDTEDNVNDNTNGDEDDNDPETIEVFDLAQIKEVVTVSPYAYGDLLEYKITLINQGNVTATNVVLTDHLPTGFSFDVADNAGWDATNAPSYDYTVVGPVLSGDTVCVPIFVTLEMTAGGTNNYTNIGEISSAEDEDGETAEDADSDPDDDPDNDGDPTDNSTDDPNEEDDHDPELVEVVDLALVKTTTDIGPFKYGDQVSFDIEIFNQGNVDAYDVSVNDFIPCGYTWVTSNEPVWTLTGNIANTNIAGPIVAGTSEIVSITLEVQACAADPAGASQRAWENISEIDSFKDEKGEDITDEDIDSDADDDPSNDNTQDDVNDNTDGDEDDNDPEEIEIFDLAQIKKIVTPAPYAYGDMIEYSICVVNQGNVTATNITITDYLPEGLGFEAAGNAGWTEAVTDIIQYTIAGPLLRDDTICIPIFLSIDMTMGGGNDHTNISEISSAEDEDGKPADDADSTADDDPDNDGDPDNDSYHDEEDDHDPADLMVVDVALVKTSSAEGPFNYGDNITFDIEVFNQGNIDLYNVIVNDFIPCGYEWLNSNSPIWTYDAATGIATTTIAGPIAAGDSIVVSKTLTIQSCDQLDAWTNVAEVQSMQDEDGEDITDDDVDSDADDDPNNDDTTDDVNDNSDGDEDDNDPETIEIFDLALRKTVVSEGPFSFGDVIEYNICVFNQGNVDAMNVEIADYLPTGFSFDAGLNPDWDSTDAPIYTYTITNRLSQQDSICIPFFATLKATDGGAHKYTNIGEIASAQDEDGNPTEDIDSDPDDDPGNDGDPNDDAIDDPDEEDDHDPAVVEIFDLALIKKIRNQNSSTGFSAGDLIMYDMVVFNQGNVDAYNVEVCDYIPAGYSYDGSLNPSWSGSGPAPTTVCTTIVGPIIAGDSATVMIQIEIMNLGSEGTIDDYRNTAEIGGAEDEDGEPQEDIDSTPDNDPDNDGDPKDDEKDNEDGDEDDSDPALPLFMDLALKKTIAGEPGPVAPGDIVTYNLTIYNQGTIDAYNVEVTDHVPPGLTLSGTDANGWDASSAPAYTNIIGGPLLVGDSTIVRIDMIVGSYKKTGDYKNTAEISSYEDEDGNMPDDYDSSPDDNPDNDGEMENDATENENGDEDDSDYEDLTTFDLALIKEVNTPGPYQTRDIIEFVISVVNQGNIPATDIEIADHVPVGFGFDPALNTIWSSSSAPTYFTTIEGPLMPFDTAQVSIFLEIVYVEDGTDIDYINVAEISGAKDVSGNPIDDIDSDPDDDPENDGDPVDDSFDHKDDEDDHDPEGIPSTGLLPPCIPSCDVACLGQINLSLDESCEASIFPSMLMSGLDAACDHDLFMEHFDIELKDEVGDLLAGNIITSDYVGQLMSYSISVIDADDDEDGTCTNSCWGNILVESKFAPRLTCGLPIDTISCLEFATYVGGAITGSGTGCFASEINIEIISDQELNVDPCDGDLLRKVIRQYQAVDVSGGRSNICTQELHVTKLIADSIKMPFVNTQTLACTDDYTIIDNSVFGSVPYYSPETGSGSAVEIIPLYPLPESICNIFIDFTDEVIIDQPCQKKVLRTWNVRQWHCNEEVNLTREQLVTLVDDEGPDITCPSDTITVSTSGRDCTARLELPEATATDSCSTSIKFDMSYPGGFIENQNGGEISGIPVGIHSITYRAYDACNSSSECEAIVKVEDNRPPVIICEKDVVVSITSTGEAHVPATVFDDGSYDACGDVQLLARRMDLSCQTSKSDSTSIEFDDYVIFCCADVGTIQMVGLRAIGHDGQGNECMVEVTVVDKNPPSLVAPPDITVSCDFVYDASDLSVFGEIATTQQGRDEIVIDADSVSIAGRPVDGLSLGSCGTEIIEEADMGSVSSCGTGTITRVFTITSNGVTVTDEQVISIVSPVEFDPTRINWPNNIVLYNVCSISDLHPNVLPDSTARPQIEDGVCELLGVSITDEQVFDPLDEGDACFKMFRTWTVVDWCKTDPLTNQPARWDSIQTLGVENSIAPVVDCPTTIVSVASFDASCDPVSITLTAQAQDECTASEELNWSWSIDLDRNGIIAETGTGSVVESAYQVGLHSIIWYAEDLCGNVSVPCIQDFELTNEKAAPAICLDHLVTDLILMDTDNDGILDAEMVEIWAADVVKDDSHPCGHELSYSFDQAGLEQNVVFSCGETGINQVQVWFTNEVNGTQSSCWAEIEVQDNNDEDLCDGTVTNPSNKADVSGLIITESGSQVSEASIQLLGSELPEANTDSNGEYAFKGMPMGGAYTVVPAKDQNYMNGVSTLDLVLIQKHILGVELLDSPYKMIAADINRSNSISASDIVQLRKLILGETEEFENNTSWRFIDQEYEFTDLSNPWVSLFPEQYDIESLSSDMDVDFVGVKVGDVSSNAKGNEFVGVEVRTNDDPLVFKAEVFDAGLEKIVEFTSDDFRKINGYQTTIEYDARKYEFIRIDGESLETTAENIGSSFAARGFITMSWHSEIPVDMDSDDVLFKAYFRKRISTEDNIVLKTSSAITTQEAYFESKITDKVFVEMIDNQVERSILLSQNEPNPWRESTVIKFVLPDNGEVQLSIFDTNGKLIKRSIDNYNIGNNEILIGREVITNPGIYLYELKYNDQKDSKRMIVID